MSDIKRVKNYKKSRQPKREMSEADGKFYREQFVNLLMPIVEKIQNLPPSGLPIPTHEELMHEFNHGVRRQPTIIQTDNGVQLPSENTKVISGGEEKKDEKIVTLYNAEEIAILESLSK